MNSFVQDVLNASVVFVGVELMNKQDARNKLAAAANAEVMSADFGLAVPSARTPEPTRRFVLQRDRISVEIVPGGSSISMEYPPNDFTKLARIVTLAIDNTEFEGQVFSKYGYNMILVVDPKLETPAIEHLGNQLFAAKEFGRQDWRRTGGLGTLFFEDGDRRWTFTIEPRPRDDTKSKKLFMAINLQVERAELPTESSVSDAFTEIMAEATRLTDQLID